MKWANTIKPFARQQDGVCAWRALLSNHAGIDKQDAMIEVAESYAMTKKQDGSGVITLEVHIERCKAAYIEMEAVADHVSHEVAGQYTRVKCLITSVDSCKDSYCTWSWQYTSF